VWLLKSLTPELTGAGARSAQGTNTGHENGEAMASVGVRVERFVRLGREGWIWQVHSRCVRFECPQKSGCAYHCGFLGRFQFTSLPNLNSRTSVRSQSHSSCVLGGGSPSHSHIAPDSQNSGRPFRSISVTASMLPV
jgi:hypothetical protein